MSDLSDKIRKHFESVTVADLLKSFNDYDGPVDEVFGALMEAHEQTEIDRLTAENVALREALKSRLAWRSCPLCGACIDGGLPHEESCLHYATEKGLES